MIIERSRHHDLYMSVLADLKFRIRRHGRRRRQALHEQAILPLLMAKIPKFLPHGFAPKIKHNLSCMVLIFVPFVVVTTWHFTSELLVSTLPDREVSTRRHALLRGFLR